MKNNKCFDLVKIFKNGANLISFLFIIFLFQISPPLSAQVSNDSLKVIIETTDGNQYVGTIQSQNSEEIILTTEIIGDVKIRKSLIVSMKTIKENELKNGQYWMEDTYATTRYFYNPSGYGLPAGEGYYQNTWILLNQVSVGITDNVSMGVGMVPVFLFTLGSSDSATPIWFTPKVSIPVQKDKVNIGVGALVGTVLGEGSGGGGILYGVSTFGPKDKNVSIGLGWGYAFDGGIANKPTVSLSYLHRGKPKWAFLTENYIISAGEETAIILSGGARYIGKKISVDFGGFTFILPGESQDIIPILPWLSIAVPFQVGGK